MKARIPKQEKQAGIQASKESNDFKIDLGQPMTQIYIKLKNIYGEMLNKYGEARILDILEYMTKPEFINLFSPATPDIRKEIKESVLKMGETCIAGKLETTIKGLQRDCNIPLEIIVKKIQTEEFNLELKKLIPHNLSVKLKDIINNYLEKLTKELDFSRTVSEYTNKFSFLEQDKFAYSIETGKISSSKFKDLNAYTRFTDLQSAIRNAKIKLRTDELGAIKNLLDKSEGLGEAELDILLSRGCLLLIPDIKSRVKQRMGQLRTDELSTVEKMLKELGDPKQLKGLKKVEKKFLEKRVKALNNPIDPLAGSSSEQEIRLK